MSSIPISGSDNEILSRTWDYVVVGTGIGGATLGYALAKAGCSVLFCEKGFSHLDSPGALAGDWLEALPGIAPDGPSDMQKALAGRFAGTLVDVTKPKHKRFQPYIGIGTGGSSALYGMVMERFFPSDFTPAEAYPRASGANLPPAWPVTYEQMLPWYVAAEKLYGVRATPDPLRSPAEERSILPPPAFSEATTRLAKGLREEGLHPYHVPLACNALPDCNECVGFLCPKSCKRDSSTVCLTPALRDHDATLLTDCDVYSLEANNGRVSAVNATWAGRDITINAKTVILAAGAIHTPAILLRSGGMKGLANGSDQVGRNVMRHFIDFYMLYPGHKLQGGLVKQIAFNDFYEIDGVKLGTVQSNGYLPPAPLIVGGVPDMLKSIWHPLGFLWPLIRPLAIAHAGRMVKGAYPLVAFCEDLPYTDNRIALSPDHKDITLTYKVSDHDKERLRIYRKALNNAFRRFKVRPVYQAHLNHMLGHIVGTCRFGNDPAASVLNSVNRAHEVDNLYVVDGSFFPTSAGVNPSLTIAANALRVADAIL